MVTALNYTDWIYRPRRPEELLPSSYGVALNQASHQIDIVRMLAGGMAVSVRAVCGRWDGERPTIGAYQAMIEFENGAVGSLIYNGYDHFDSDELNGWTDELGQPKIRDRLGSARRTLKLQRASDSEAEIKRSAGYGGAGARRATSSFGIDGQGHQQFGVIIASCERGDIRTSTTGVTIYDAEGRREIALHPGRGGGSRSGVFDQLYDAVIHGVTPVHSGRWGLANLEVCLAMVESSQTRRDVPLKYQLHPELGVAADLKPA